MRRLLYSAIVVFGSIASHAFAGTQEAPAVKPLFSISYGEAEASVGDALTGKGAGGKVAAYITGRQKEALFSYGKPMTVRVGGLQFDKSSSQWSANLLAVSEGEVLTAVPASGRYEEITEVPVLKRAISNGAVVTASDIEIRDIPTRSIRGDIITSMGELIGKSPIYTISPSRPIRTHEIAAPTLVKKNTVVQMHYRSPGMEITTSGQAMEDGAKGALINVKNMESKRVVQAIVMDAQTVSISPPPERKSSASIKQAEQLHPLGELYATN